MKHISMCPSKTRTFVYFSTCPQSPSPRDSVTNQQAPDAPTYRSRPNRIDCSGCGLPLEHSDRATVVQRPSNLSETNGSQMR